MDTDKASGGSMDDRRPSPENELLFILDILLLGARLIVPLGSVLRKEPAQAQAAAPPCQPYSSMPCCAVPVHRRLLPHLSPMLHLYRYLSPPHSAALFLPLSHLSITYLFDEVVLKTAEGRTACPCIHKHMHTHYTYRHGNSFLCESLIWFKASGF